MRAEMEAEMQRVRASFRAEIVPAAPAAASSPGRGRRARRPAPGRARRRRDPRDALAPRRRLARAALAGARCDVGRADLVVRLGVSPRGLCVGGIGPLGRRGAPRLGMGPAPGRIR